jgi:hypothetical protein
VHPECNGERDLSASDLEEVLGEGTEFHDRRKIK